MTARTTRGRRHALAVLAAMAAVAVIAIAAVVAALPGRTPGRAFPALVPAAAPAGWLHLTLPNGTAAPAAGWAQARPLLFRAVAAYLVR